VDDPTVLLTALEGGDEESAQAAALALGAMGEAALPLLRPLTTSPCADTRWWAARALAETGASGAIPLLAGLLHDPDEDVRACAVLALGELQRSEAVEPLVTALQDPSGYVARLAGNALIRLGERAVSALIEVLEAGPPRARVNAARALAALEAPEAIPTLIRALEDPSALVVHYAEEALEKLGVGMIFFQP